MSNEIIILMALVGVCCSRSWWAFACAGCLCVFLQNGRLGTMKLTRRNSHQGRAQPQLPPTIISRASAQAVKQLHVGVLPIRRLGRLVSKGGHSEVRGRVQMPRPSPSKGRRSSNIAALRATRDAPRFSVMMMDDCRHTQAQAGGPDRQARPPTKIPNWEKV